MTRAGLPQVLMVPLPCAFFPEVFAAFRKGLAMLGGAEREGERDGETERDRGEERERQRQGRGGRQSACAGGP